VSTFDALSPICDPFAAPDRKSKKTRKNMASAPISGIDASQRPLRINWGSIQADELGRWLLRVKPGSSPGVPATSEAGGEADISDGMSQAEGYADLNRAWPERRVLAMSRHGRPLK